MSIQNVKGTHDIFGSESNAFNAVESLMRTVAELFAYSEVRPPVLEHSELFVRGVGESSDVVRKEMYTFLDKGERSLTLRPEFTAGIVRLLVQNKLLNNVELPLKSYYLGPVFRYERPQLGRYRQFNQFGVESIGHNSIHNDIEVIILAYTILQSLGLENVILKINTLGDEESRNNYKTALKEFFKDKIGNMCPDCQSRYELNPLRILDCKVPEDQEIVKDAPKMSKFLSEASKARFNELLSDLEEHGIPVEVDDTLVRGLDYYSETVFEFHYTSKEGNNYGAIGAGGHYDKLVHEVGGPDMPGVGFSFGIERIVSVLKDDNLLPDELINGGIDVYVMPVGENAVLKANMLANTCRMMSLKTDICFDNTKIGNMFKRAEKKNAKFAVILGEEEISNRQVVIKDLSSKEQFTVNEEVFVNKLNELMHSGENHECGCGCGCHHDNDEDCCCCHDDEHEEGCCCHHKEEK